MRRDAAPLVALLLAAGSATRFGADKLRQPLVDGTPVAVAACRPYLAAGLEVLAVLRPGQDELAGLLAVAGARIVIATDAASGMGRSLAAGVAASADARGWIVGLADMPQIATATITAVRDALAGGAAIAAPLVGGQRAHPVGFAADYRDELLALQGDAGARAIVRRDAGKLIGIACSDPGALLDIDHPADLAALNTRTA